MRRLEQARDTTQERGFAAAIGADQRGHRARFYGQIQFMHDNGFAVITQRQLLQGDHFAFTRLFTHQRDKGCPNQTREGQPLELSSRPANRSRCFRSAQSGTMVVDNVLGALKASLIVSLDVDDQRAFAGAHLAIGEAELHLAQRIVVGGVHLAIKVIAKRLEIARCLCRWDACLCLVHDHSPARTLASTSSSTAIAASGPPTLVHSEPSMTTTRSF